MSCYTQKRTRGFTLAEVMIALLVLTLGALSAAHFLGTVARAADFTERTAIATALAQARVEDMLRLRPSLLAGGSDEVLSYRRSWAVDGSGAKTITATVGWHDIDGRARQVIVKTCLGQ